MRAVGEIKMPFIETGKPRKVFIVGGGCSDGGSQGYVAKEKGWRPCSRHPGRHCVLQTLVVVELVSSTWGFQTGPKEKMYFSLPPWHMPSECIQVSTGECETCFS